jgi:hypothetical protein
MDLHSRSVRHHEKAPISMSTKAKTRHGVYKTNEKSNMSPGAHVCYTGVKKQTYLKEAPESIPSLT